MLLVIHNHWALDYNNSAIKIFIASFHMPLFFLLSGLTLKTPDNLKDLGIHILKRIKTILLPFYLWSFCYMGFGLRKAAFILYGSNRSISNVGGIGGSWFLPCFFVADILACLAFYVTRKNGKYLGLLAILYFVVSFGLNFINLGYDFPFNLDVAFSGAAFICIGHYADEKKVFDVIEKNNSLKKSILAGVFFILTGLFAFLNVPAYNNDFGRLVMALGYYGYFWMFVLSGLAGALLVIIISMNLQNLKLSNYLAMIGTNTFTILLMQQFVIDLIEKVIKKLDVSLMFIYPIILSVICIVICDVASRLLVEIYPNLKGFGILPKLDKI